MSLSSDSDRNQITIIFETLSGKKVIKVFNTLHRAANRAKHLLGEFEIIEDDGHGQSFAVSINGKSRLRVRGVDLWTLFGVEK